MALEQVGDRRLEVGVLDIGFPVGLSLRPKSSSTM
jgi:hypothetical protein